MGWLSKQSCTPIEPVSSLAQGVEPGLEATHLEVIRSSAQELVSDVQRLATLDAAKVPLARHHAPRLVADIHEDL